MREDRKVSRKARRKDTLSAEDLGILLQWWYKSNACRRKMATRQERCHGRKSPGASKPLVPASLWCQHSSGTSIVLRQREEWIRFSYSNEDTKDEERRRAGSPTDD
jgi:hypothetical protein